MKKFNTAAVCIPEKHYMVDISRTVNEIKKMVDDGKYFTINKARQYGKTTTLMELKKILVKEYTVLSFSFEGVTGANFETEESFVKAFCRLLKKNPVLYRLIPEEIIIRFEDYISRREDNKEQQQLMMYGFIVNDHNTVLVSNKIFEMRLYKYFVGESRFSKELRGDALDSKPEFIKDGVLDVPLIMERFIESQKAIRNQINI